jgi:hypothetical protein
MVGAEFESVKPTGTIDKLGKVKYNARFNMDRGGLFAYSYHSYIRRCFICRFFNLFQYFIKMKFLAQAVNNAQKTPFKNRQKGDIFTRR